tara:strand:- start:65 stop:253 length:189 start_codon:yes stop_codon:yes gene_type:complete
MLAAVEVLEIMNVMLMPTLLLEEEMVEDLREMHMMVPLIVVAVAVVMDGEILEVVEMVVLES